MHRRRLEKRSFVDDDALFATIGSRQQLGAATSAQGIKHQASSIFHLTGGQVHESTVVDEVLISANNLSDCEGEPVAWPITVSGDKGSKSIAAYSLGMKSPPRTLVE